MNSPQRPVCPVRPQAPRRRGPGGAHVRTQHPSSPESSAERTPAPEKSQPAEPARSSRVIDARDRFLAVVRPRPWLKTRRVLMMSAGALVLIAALVLAGLVYLPYFKVADTSVSGLTYVKNEEVTSVLHEAQGAPLAFVNTSDLEERLRAVPGVKTATITRTWPDHLSADITERIPAATLQRDGGTRIVDASGVSLPGAAAAKKTLPVLAVPAGVKDPEAVQAALLEVLAALPADLRTQVTTMSAATPSSVTLSLRVENAQKKVVWGGPEDSALKAQVLAALAGEPGSVIDLTSPKAPTVH